MGLETNIPITDVGVRELAIDLNGLRELFNQYKESQKTAFSDYKSAQEKLIQEREQRFEQRFLATEKLNLQTQQSNKAAVDKAEEAQKQYNERSNEFRGQLDDQAKLFMPRTESLANYGRISEKVDALDKSIDGKFETMHKMIDAIDRWKEGISVRLPTIEGKVNANSTMIESLNTWKTRTTGVAIGMSIGAATGGGILGAIITKMVGV